MTAGMAIYDTMQFIKPNVSTVCIGQAASMGAFLLAGGANVRMLAIACDIDDVHVACSHGVSSRCSQVAVG